MDAVTSNLPLFLDGFWATIRLTLLAGVIALVLGLVVALCRVSPVGPAWWGGTAFVEFVRNVPLLAHLFFWVFGLPFVGILLPEFVAAFCGLGVYTAAFVAEAMRAGIQAVARGQTEAELLFQTQVINARTFATYPVFFMSAALYLLLTLPMGAAVGHLERTLTRFRSAAQA